MRAAAPGRRPPGRGDAQGRSAVSPHPPVVVLDGGWVDEEDVIANTRCPAAGGPADEHRLAPGHDSSCGYWIALLVNVGAFGHRLRSNGLAGTPSQLAWETLLDLSAARPGPPHLAPPSALRAATRGGAPPPGGSRAPR